MENLSRELLKQFLNMDEKVVLYAKDGSFEIPLSVTAAKMYSPVIKATLETPIGKGHELTSASKESTKSLFRLPRIEVDGFTHETAQMFVRCLQGQADENEIKSYDWKRIKGLLKMSHFYQVENLYDLSLEKGKSLIQHNNVLDAIKLLETYDFNQAWCDTIVNTLVSNPNPMQQPEWKDAVTQFPNTMTRIQYWFIKRKLGYG